MPVRRHVIDARLYKPTSDSPLLDIKPIVSFVVPTFNSGKTLEASLRSIRWQTYTNVEIVIVDKSSADSTLEIAKRFADRIVFDDGTYGSACQTGVENSQGEVVALWDDDIFLPSREWLAEALRYFEVSPRVCMVIQVDESPPDAPLLSKAYFKFHEAVIIHRVKRGTGYLAGRLVLKSSIDRVGGYNRQVHWGADFSFSKKFYDAGYWAAYTGKPIIHASMFSPREFLRKQIMGARTFTKDMFGSMGLSLSEVMYEHFIVGLKAAVNGVFRRREKEWLLFPVILLLRLITYGIMIVSTYGSDPKLKR